MLGQFFRKNIKHTWKSEKIWFFIYLATSDRNVEHYFQILDIFFIFSSILWALSLPGHFWAHFAVYPADYSSDRVWKGLDPEWGPKSWYPSIFSPRKFPNHVACFVIFRIICSSNIFSVSNFWPSLLLVWPAEVLQSNWQSFYVYLVSSFAFIDISY